jgi:tetratricopeptide (TPR) repeat protein
MIEKTGNNTQPRVIRVFVSSTFRDMQAERDELGKFIFPQLRKLCEKRAVTFGDVDLRWGIPDEKKSEILSICLHEIENCRPYFIGMLGERYGSLPDEIPADLIERQPWLKDDLDRSVTELEILHGVLNDPAMTKRAFVYLRDPGYVKTLPPDQRINYLERDASRGIQKLKDLKDRIRTSGARVYQNYRDPREFGQIVLQDLTAIIEELFPEDSQPDALDSQAMEHEAFAQSRAQVYIPQPAAFERLDAHAEAEGLPLVIIGESGSGKSALLANWAMRYRQDHPGELVLMHFIGATPGSADWAAILQRILGEMKRKLKIEEELPDKPEALRLAFANWLNMAAARGRLILVLDALNQLDDRDGAPDLTWLPAHVPGNVRILVSTLPGRSLDELGKRGWPTFQVEPLQPDDRKRLIKEYLALSSKALSSAHTGLIAGTEQCQNPLFLRVLLDELRLFGKFDELGPHIKSYLSAPSIPALYMLILDRCERDYERDRPGMVREAMSMLWAARRGLSEAELMDLLGAGGQPLAHAHWSPLYLALEQSFINRAGLIGFFHDHLRQAVQNKYLNDALLQRSAHLRLADQFEAQPGGSLRRLDELPWQLSKAGDWQRLYDLLGDLEFLNAAWKVDPFDIKRYWVQVEANSPLRMVNCYRKVIEHPGEHKEHARMVSILLNDTGRIDEALSLFDYLIEHYRAAGDKARLARTLSGKAIILNKRGDLNEAMALHKVEERISRELGDQHTLQVSLGNQAVILFALGNLDEALALQKEQERLSRAAGNKLELASALGNQANILYLRGNPGGAMALFKEQERICRQLGDKAGLSRSLGNQAIVLFASSNDVQGVLALQKEQEHICRELGDPQGLAISLINQAGTLVFMGKKGEAHALAHESLTLAQEKGYQALVRQISSAIKKWEI